MYPEHEKLRAIAPISQAQGEFVDWLQHKIALPWLDLPKLLAEYHEIDLKALEAEKQAMLAAIRKEQT